MQQSRAVPVVYSLKRGACRHPGEGGCVLCEVYPAPRTAAGGQAGLDNDLGLTPAEALPHKAVLSVACILI